MYKNITFRSRALLVLGLVISMISVEAAESNEKNAVREVEEVLVTASRRESFAQSTPVALTALSSSDRDRLGLLTIQDIAAFTPGVSYQSDPNRITIRGVGRLENALGSDPGVATYYNGTYTSETASIGTIPLFIERTEILRGPQGTLFGRNSVGGLVNVISRRADDEFSMDVQTNFGDYGRNLIATSITGPVLDNVRYRLNALKDKRDGYQNNLSGTNGESNDLSYVELHLEADITDRLSMWLKYNRTETDSLTRARAVVAPYASGISQGSLVPFAQYGLSENPTLNDNRKVRSDHEGRSILDNTNQIILQLSYAFENFEVKYIGSDAQYDFTNDTDYDGTDRASFDYPLFNPVTFMPYSIPVSSYQVNYLEENKRYDSHEIQVTTSSEDKVQFVGGLYHYKESVEQPFHIRSPYETALYSPFSFVTFGAGNPNPNGDFYYQLGTIDSEAYAAYGQFDIELTEQLNLTLGLRYSEDKKDGYEEQRVILYNPIGNVFGAFGFPLPAGTSVDISANGNGPASRYLSNEWDALTGKIGLDYQMTDDILIYGNVATAYKSGGMKLGSLEALDLTQPDGISLSGSPFVEEEKVLTYEAGIKSDLLDKKLRLNLAAFYYDYEDMQAPVSRRNENDINIPMFINVPESTVYGFEIESTLFVANSLQLIANYSYLRAEITDEFLLVDTNFPVSERVEEDVNGHSLPKSPENKLTLAATYYLDTEIGDFNFTADWSYSSKQNTSFFERSIYEIESYAISGARVAFTPSDNSFRAILGVSNITDEDVPINSLAISGEQNNFARIEGPAFPRVLYLELTKTFGKNR
ncbi:TonB-dependent receptor [Gammaproteobacteria bacterium]|nr:TonB-dependent receptor [Gammaproteobacteria bacterium]